MLVVFFFFGGGGGGGGDAQKYCLMRGGGGGEGHARNVRGLGGHNNFQMTLPQIPPEPPPPPPPSLIKNEPSLSREEIDILHIK